MLKLTFLVQVLSGRQYSFLLRNMKPNDLTHFVALDYLCTPVFSLKTENLCFPDVSCRYKKTSSMKWVDCPLKR